MLKKLVEKYGKLATPVRSTRLPIALPPWWSRRLSPLLRWLWQASRFSLIAAKEQSAPPTRTWEADTPESLQHALDAAPEVPYDIKGENSTACVLYFDVTAPSQAATAAATATATASSSAAATAARGSERGAPSTPTPTA